jgi:CelD/BcsL family acetyltransferase involved in cellulose biosynthesis
MGKRRGQHWASNPPRDERPESAAPELPFPVPVILARRAGASASTPRNVTLATTIAEVEKLRDRWTSLDVTNLDSDIDYFLTVVAHLPDVYAPHVLVVPRPGQPDMIVVARLERHVFPVKAGYTDVLRPHLTTVVVSFGGFLGARTAADFARAVNALRSSLSAVHAGAVILQKVPVEGELHRAVMAGSSRATRISGLPVTRRWYVDLPETLDELLERRSVKARKEAHYEARRLRRKYDDLRVERLDLDGVDRVHSEIEAVAQTTYQRALGVGANQSALGRALTELTFGQGRLRVWMLYLNGSPVAFWWGNQHGDSFAIDTPGFDPAYAKDGVGIFVMHAMLDELCQDPAISVVDFGHGYAEYKERYATVSEEQGDLIILAARPGPLVVGQFVAVTAATNRLAHRLLRDRAVTQRLKRRWRTRLTDRTPRG